TLFPYTTLFRSIIHTDKAGNKTVLKDGLALQKGEIFDATYMSKKALLAFLKSEVKDAKDKDVLFSLHMKATMMKVSDPIIFGHAVKAYFADVFEKYAAELEQVGANPNNGLGNIYSEIQELSEAKRKEIETAIRSEVKDAKDKDVLFSLHMKATMMKVSEPIIFGHAVKAYFADVFEKYAAELEQVGANPNNGLGNIYSEIQELSEAKRKEIETAIALAIE